jgi:hypothetical protein
VLRPSNASTLCCPCYGTWEIPETALALAEISGGDHQLMDRIAERIMGVPTDYSTRNASIRKDYADGMYTQEDLAQLWGLSQITINEIVNFRKSHS